jgi:hypothetical protein
MSTAGSPILAADYNNIWNLVSTVLGTGISQYGFGQTLASNQVAVKSQFKLSDWVNLRTDLLKIGVHQSGSPSGEAALLLPPGNLSPVTVSSATAPALVTGKYRVTFTFPIQLVAPNIGSSYKITGCANSNYNGTYTAKDSSVTSITVEYNSNPGTYSVAKPVQISAVLTYDLMKSYADYAQLVYTKAYNSTVVLVGTTNSTVTLTTTSASILMVGASVSGSGIDPSAVVSSVNPGVSITLNIPASTNVSSGTFTLTLVTGIKTVATNQLSTTALTSVVRNTSWNGNIQTIGTFTFASTDVARAFFNAGSQIEIAPTLNGVFGAASTVKDNTWATMFSQVGKIIFRANDTIQDNTSTGGSGIDNASTNASQHHAIGWFGLTGLPRLVFTKNAPTGIAYSANALNVFAQLGGNGTQLILTVRFQDDAGGNVDENVDGTLTVAFSSTYASGTNVSTQPPAASATPIQ